jgi:hypothetical protein
MSYWFIRKTSLWGSKTSEKKDKGAMFIVTVFTFFIFSALALSMIFLSQVYLRLGGFRKNSVLLDYSSENGIKDGFHYLMKAMSSAPLPLVISEEKFSQLRDSTKNADVRIIEEALGIHLPVEIHEGGGQMIWRSQATGVLETIFEGENFFSARFKLLIDSEGGLKNFLPKRTSSLETRLGILAGHVPFPLIPFLISKKLDPAEKENFEENNNITFAPLPNNLLYPGASFVEEGLIPQDANSLLEKALKIKIFEPQDLSNARLRAVLGLENSTEPVPEGVYLIQNDLGLGGVYIQGDVEEMVTAIEQDFQVIAFQMEAGLWILKFSPSQSKTYFHAPRGVQAYDFVPLGIIIVSGKIKSLGGGMVDPGGKICLVKDEEIPSILRGINLTIIASDKINLTSHLLRQGVKWQEGIPYVKDENAQVVIFSTGKDFQEDRLKEGGIIIDENSPQEIKIQAALTAQGEGFKIQGDKKTVHILGSLQATDYLSGESQLEMTPFLPLASIKNSSLNSPATAEPILFLSFFETYEWKEF